MAGKDYYSIMGLSRSTFTDKDLKASYRRLARQYHPDVNPGNRAAEEKFKEINKAYEVLSSLEKRQKYDRYGDQWEEAEHLAEESRQQESRWDFNRESGSGQTFRSQRASAESIFDEFLGQKKGNGFTRETAGTRQGLDIEYPIEITLEEAYNGTVRNISVQSEVPCVTCGGTGRVQRQPCPVCRATGKAPQTNHLQVKIPAGVNSGSRIRIAGRGHPGPNKETSGDLYLVVSVQPHPMFKRKDDDIHVDVFVPLTTAVLGGELQVPTLNGGKLVLKIPPETQNERTFRLAGQGMPHLGYSSRGDLLVTLKVNLPTGLTAEERAFFTRLKQRVQNNGG